MERALADERRNLKRILEKNRYDLIISDIMMPMDTGLSLISRIRELAPSIKVIYLSAWLDESETEVKLQQELLEAAKTKEDQPVIYEAAKERLRQWKLADGQISEIEKSGKVQNIMNIESNTNGIYFITQSKQR
jgi:CheY-like chemotaxis protein